MVARTAGNHALLALVCLAAALSFPLRIEAAAGGVGTCTAGESCTVGEFLYDDEYTALNTASCSVTSRYPDGSLFLDQTALSLSSENDGWYSTTFTTPETTGYYRTQICCTVSGEVLCVDKGFETVSSQTSDEIASAVWDYSGRTLSSFGNLASDIWSYSTRTLSSFGTLVSDIWTNSTRTLTKADLDSGKLATQSDVEKVDSQSNITNVTTNVTNIKEVVDETRLLVEKVVNKPIVENVIEEEVPDLSEKLKETRAVSNQLFVNNQYLAARSASLASDWGRLSSSDLLKEILELSRLLGDETDSQSAKTVFGEVNWVRDAWDWNSAHDIRLRLSEAGKVLNSIQESLASYEKTTRSREEMKRLAKMFFAIEKGIGLSTDSAFQESLYARIKATEDTIIALDERGQEVDRLLLGWEKEKNSAGFKLKVDDVQRKVIAVNKVPKILSVLSVKPSGQIFKDLKNRLLALKGVLSTNKILLSKGAGKALTNTWIEEGSMIFKSLATNPSSLVSQKVEVKYYLPQELKEEDIVEVDTGLAVKYDSEKNQLYVEGEFTLAAGETRTFSVKTEDIWQISTERIESLRQQADELAKPLEKTAYYAQGVSLKSDVNASLDKMKELLGSATTPEQKIKAYRQAEIEEKAVEEKLAGLKELVGQVSAAGSLLGFVGGAQAIAVWGLIIIMAAGFVFLALYMKTINGNGKEGEVKEKPAEPKSFSASRLFKSLIPLITVSLITAAFTSFVVSRQLKKSYESRLSVLGETAGEEVEDKELENDQIREEENNQVSSVNSLGVGGTDLVRVEVPEGSTVNLRQEPSPSASRVALLTASQDAVRIAEKGEWVNVILDESGEFGKEGWIAKEFVIEKADSSLDSQEPETVLIKDTPTGWLRVREVPWGAETGRVFPGEEYSLLDESSGWYKILLDEGSGWISKDYATHF